MRGRGLRFTLPFRGAPHEIYKLIVFEMSPQKILIIEDDALLANTLEEKFKEGGFAVFSALDGEAGLKRAEEERPDIILLDLVLPRKNGFEVLESLKNTEKLSEIPVVVFTNLESDEDIEHAYSLGALAYLIKANYSLTEVFKKTVQVLSQKQT